MSSTYQNVENHSIEAAVRALLGTEAATSNQGLRQRLISLDQKLASDQLHLAVLGQMKRGKSSFINALLGAEVLPTGVLPVTAIITEIEYGSDPCATVRYTSGESREIALNSLPDYVTEAGNPGNRKQVASITISYPSPFLSNGIILIDTPGIGSTHRHNTEATERYLEQIDAGIVVLSVDPPITEAESQFVRRLKDDIPKLFFILNKSDLVSPAEISAIQHFLSDELDRLQVDTPEIFPLSARYSLLNKQRDTVSSMPGGIEPFEDRLRSFLLDEKRQVLIRSVALDVLQVARALRFAASVGMHAAHLTLEELECKRLALNELLQRTEVERNELRVLLRQSSADLLTNIERDLTVQAQSSVPEVRHHLKQFEQQHPKETGRQLGVALEGFLMGEVETIFRTWRLCEDERVQAQLNTLSARFVEQTNGILEELGRAAGSLFDIPVEHLAISCSLQIQSRLFYKVEPVFYSLDNFLLLLPRPLLRPIILRRMYANIPLLLDMNAGRIRYDYLERIQQTMAEFEKNLASAVATVTESLRAALQSSPNAAQHHLETMTALESVIRDCAQLLPSARITR